MSKGMQVARLMRKRHQRCDSCGRESGHLFPVEGAAGRWFCGDCVPHIKRAECDIGVGTKVDIWDSPGRGVPDTKTGGNE